MHHLGQGLGRRKSIWEALHVDFPLLITLLILLGFGLMVLYSATDGNMGQMSRQVALIVVALMTMLFMAQIEMRILRRWSIWMYLGGLILLVAVIFMGSIGGGSPLAGLALAAPFPAIGSDEGGLAHDHRRLFFAACTTPPIQTCFLVTGSGHGAGCPDCHSA